MVVVPFKRLPLHNPLLFPLLLHKSICRVMPFVMAMQQQTFREAMLLILIPGRGQLPLLHLLQIFVPEVIPVLLQMPPGVALLNRLPSHSHLFLAAVVAVLLLPAKTKTVPHP